MSFDPFSIEGRKPESRDSILARNLLVAGLAAGVTQQQLADLAGVSRATIAQLEAGLSDPRLSTIVDLAKAIRISPVLLLSGKLELSALTELAGQSGSLIVSAKDLRQMSEWTATGMIRDRVRAARIGAAVAQASGSTQSGVVGAAIGSAVNPGWGTVSGALFGELSSEWGTTAKDKPSD